MKLVLIDLDRRIMTPDKLIYVAAVMVYVNRKFATNAVYLRMFASRYMRTTHTCIVLYICMETQLMRLSL